MPDRTTARIVIERFIDDAGRDLVNVHTDNLEGDRLDVVEALGLLQLAMWDVCNHPADDDDPPDDA